MHQKLSLGNSCLLVGFYFVRSLKVANRKVKVGVYVFLMLITSH